MGFTLGKKNVLKLGFLAQCCALLCGFGALKSGPVRITSL